jgi:hypothetical protein
MATKKTTTDKMNTDTQGRFTSYSAIVQTQHPTTGPNGPRYTPDELRTLMEAIGMAPSWLSKRFIMQELCGWSEDRMKLNVKLKQEEDQQSQIGNRTGGYR